jgi:hypothetical protein
MDKSYKLTKGVVFSTLSLEIPSAVAVALEAGQATLETTFGPKGVDVWVRDLSDPNVYHQSMDLTDAASHFRGKRQRSVSFKENSSANSSDEGLGAKLKDVRIRATQSRPVGTREPGLDLVTMTRADASAMVEDRKLNRHRVAGVLNFYPDKSLVKQDFSRASIHDFVARATVVAEAIGEDKAVARIATNPELDCGGASDLHEWWRKSSSRQKAILLSTKKDLRVDLVHTGSLNNMGCPFGAADLVEKTQ